MTFLDSHCECNPGWLEPLLAEVAADRSTVTCPVIDGISANNFKYSALGTSIGGFDWDFTFKW